MSPEAPEADEPPGRAVADVEVTFAVLPVKRFDDAKQRLDGELSPGMRRALAEAMLTDVLLALRRAEAVAEVLMVTAEPAAEAIGRGYGALVIHEPVQEGQSPAAQLGVRHALDAGASRVLLVPGDCPALDPLELDALLAQPPVGRPGAVVVP
ncbi:MAG: NTP transferase domain-containing protein, partial [Actinomycetota bacterium]|nr:NTP transferase domain-containing protein [Actinomycetota bacterium]